MRSAERGAERGVKQALRAVLEKLLCQEVVHALVCKEKDDGVAGGSEME